MRKPRAKAAPAALAPLPGVEPRSGPPWHEGRTFYSCGRCSAQDERTKEHLSHPLALDCWNCGGEGSMHQWVPPAVKREREAANVGSG